MRYLVLTCFIVRIAAFYITATIDRPAPTQIGLTSVDTFQASSATVRSTTITPSLTAITFSSLMTIAPLSRNPLELRQRCWNDQGFSVDCAVWTGYRYTWGGAGHPYAGGPGEGGGAGAGGSGTNNAGISGIMGAANRVQGVIWPCIATLTTICVLVLL